MKLPKYFPKDQQHYPNMNINRGWIALPPEYKIQEGQSLVITKGFDNLVYLYFEPEFLKLVDIFEKLLLHAKEDGNNEKEIRTVMHFFMGGAMDVDVNMEDNAIYIPRILQNYIFEKERGELLQIYSNEEVPYTWMALGVWQKEK